MAVPTTTGTDSEAYLDHVLKQYQEKVGKMGLRRIPKDIKGKIHKQTLVLGTLSLSCDISVLMYFS